MDALQKDGRFVEATNVPGSSFGVSYNAIDRITDEGKICLMDLDVAVLFLTSDIWFMVNGNTLQGMVALEKSEYQPHFIFFAIQDQDQPPTKPSSPSSPSNESDISRAVNYGKSSRGSSAKGQDPKSSDTAHWLMRAEAAIKEQFSASDFFSVSIVTDQSDRAHTTFRDFCLGVYWASIATEHS